MKLYRHIQSRLWVGITLLAPVFPVALSSHPFHTHEKEVVAGKEQTWTMDHFLDFIEGSFDDGGVNAYVAADGSIRLVNQFDLTHDGYLDILLPNAHGHNEIVDFHIHWAKDNWNEGTRLSLPSNGGKTLKAGDLNNDGYLDLVLVNRFNGTKSELDLWIYWGSEKGYSPGRRGSLPVRGAEEVAIDDLNGDGFQDIVAANSGLSYHVSVDSYNQSYIYWNRGGAFDPADRTDLPTSHARDVAVADLNRDGAPDIVFANQGNDDNEAGLRIFLNRGDGGFGDGQFQHLPGERTSAVEATDLNRDGWPDLVAANAFELKGREGDIYNIIETTTLNSSIFWGGPDGFSPGRNAELPTVSAGDVATGDLNRDGWVDIFFAQSAGGASFVYWGSPEGFIPNRRLAIPGERHEVGEITDLNGDGWNDLIVGSSLADGHHNTDVTVYWGNSGGLDLENPHKIPAYGVSGLWAGDLDRDGMRDLVVVNRNEGPGGSRSPAWLYPGGPDGYSVDDRVELPTGASDSYLPTDLNADGYTDLVFLQDPPTIFRGGPKGLELDRPTSITDQYAVSARASDFNRDGYLDLALSEWSPGLDRTHLYYGGPSGFSSSHRQHFPISSVRFHTIADLDGNGWVDILFPNFIDEELVLFWNDALGFDPEKKTVLPMRSAVTVEVADLNGNGYLDIIVPNMYDTNPEPGKAGAHSFGGSPQGDTFIYWGGPEGYDAERRTILPSVGSADVVASDLNHDGALDLVIASYHAGVTRSHPSSIYWNGPEGFSPDRLTPIPTHSASGVLVADFNRDEWKDILFANHSKNGDHRTDSWLYFGGSDGFSPDRRQSLPGLGPHFLSAVDIGHVAGRDDYYHYTSPVYDAGEVTRLEALRWDANTPFDTGVHFQVRSASNEQSLQAAPWVGPRGEDSWFERQADPLSVQTVAGRWFQWRARLISPNSANSPVLHGVSLRFLKP